MHEKILYLPPNKRNTNENYTEISFSPILSINTKENVSNNIFLIIVIFRW